MVDRETDVFITKICDAFILLSDEAKDFIESNLDEDDINDFERLLGYYQFIIEDRNYTEDYDKHDSDIINKLEHLVELFKIYLE